MLTWTERILSLPVRTAAVAEFLRELSAKGWGDLNGVLATFNDGELCREALGYWLEREWIVRAPSSALSALTGPAFSRELTLQEFCGEEGEEWEEQEDDFAEAGALSPPPSGRSLREARPPAAAGTDVKRGEAPRAPPHGRGEEAEDEDQ